MGEPNHNSSVVHNDVGVDDGVVVVGISTEIKESTEEYEKWHFFWCQQKH